VRTITINRETGAEVAKHAEALLQLKACFWCANVHPLRGHLQAPVPEELAEFHAGGSDWFKGIYPADAETVREAAARVAQGMESPPLEYRMVVENGGIVWVRQWFLEGSGSEEDRGEVSGFVQVLDERKRLEADCLRVCEREKAAIGQELHDDVCQLLAGVACLLEVIAQKAKTAMPELMPTFKDLSAQLNAGMDRTRSLAHSLVPMRLVTMGLPGALRELASQAERNFNIKVHVSLPRTLPAQKPEQILHLYRIVQEAISNAFKHGKATVVRVELVRDRNKMSLTVRDNGSGIPEEASRKQGIGLHIMRYRAGALGGQVQISPEAGQGSIVTVTYDGGAAPKRIQRSSS
jgi:signal transduction histidine kinase